MIDKRYLAVLLAGSTVLASCGKSPPEPAREDGYAPAAATDPSAKFRAMPEKQLLGLAFDAAFKGQRSLTLDDAHYVFTPEAVRWVGGRAVLISGGRGDECHGCSGTLALHYLQPKGDGLEVVGAWPQAASGASYGQPPEWTLRTDLASNPVLETRGGGTFQGYTCNAAQLVELKSDAPVTIARDVQLTYSDEGAVAEGRAQSISGTIIPDARDRSFIVAYNGSTSARVTYERHGQIYEKAKGAPELPSC